MVSGRGSDWASIIVESTIASSGNGESGSFGDEGMDRGDKIGSTAWRLFFLKK